MEEIMNNFSRSIHERLIRVLIRRNPELTYTDEELKQNGVTRDELVTYMNTHPEILDTSDDDSLVNFNKDFTGSFYEIGVTQGHNYGVFDSDDNCIYEGESKQDCVDYCNKNNYEYKIKSNFSERIKNAFKSQYPTNLEALNFLGDLGCTAANGNLMNESGILDHVRSFIDKYLNKDQTIFILNKLLNYTSDGCTVECHVRREGVPKLKWALDKLGLNMLIYSGEFDFIHRPSAKGLDSIT